MPGGINGVVSGFDQLRNQQATIANQGDNGKYGPIYQRDGVTCTNRKDNGGWQVTPPKKRSTPAERRAPLDKRGPVLSRPNFPNTPEEQKAYIESKGLDYHPGVQHGPLGAALAPTNCTGYI